MLPVDVKRENDKGLEGCIKDGAINSNLIFLLYF